MNLLNPLENKIQTKKLSKAKVGDVEGLALPEAMITPSLTREELLEISQNISLYFAPKVTSNTRKLVLLSVDPEHLHIYWNLAESQNRVNSSTQLNSDLSLQIYSQENKKGRVKTKKIADYNVKRSLSKQTISIPSSKKGKTYFAQLGESNLDQDYSILVTSNSINSFQIKNVLIENNFTDTGNDYESINEKKFYGQTKPEIVHYLHTYYSGKGSRL